MTFELAPLGPFSLAASTRFLEGFAPAAHPPSAVGHLHLAFPVDGSGDSAGVWCRQPAGHDTPVVVEAAAARDSVTLHRQVARILSLDTDGRGFPAVGQRDPVVGDLQRRYHGLRPVAFFSPYEAAAWALISARTSIRQASAVKARMATELGDRVEVHGELLHAFPAPHRLRELDAFPGLFGRKPEWLRALAEATLAGRLDAEHLRSRPEELALKELMQLPGIGPFSAGLILLRGANVPDALPAAEPRLARAVALASGLDREPDFPAIERLAEQWRPYRTWVTVLLRRFLEDKTGEIEAAYRQARAADSNDQLSPG